MLARIPALPQIFDAMLLVHAWIFRRRVFRAIVQLENEARTLGEIEIRSHRFGGMAFCRNGCELGHVHGNGLFDALLPRATRDHFVACGLVEPHHVFPQSRWISLWLHSATDVSAAVAVLRAAAVS